MSRFQVGVALPESRSRASRLSRHARCFQLQGGSPLHLRVPLSSFASGESTVTGSVKGGHRVL
eukprot:203888-Rhodomonas_salina.1